MRVAKVVTLTAKERTALLKWSRGRSTPARLVQRANIVLAAADGKQNDEIAADLGCTRRTVGTWRNRFVNNRLEGIRKDAPRGGRKPTRRAAVAAEIVRKTTQEKPANATHWSTRSVAKAMNISDSMVRRVWRDSGLKPHLVKTFKVSNDPRFVEKLVDVVGLYLNPPEHALVMSCDEKSQFQALDRTQKSLPIYPGRLGTLTHDYKRNGTTTLFAAIEVAEGKIIAECMPRHRHREWLKFLKKIDAETPSDLDLASDRGQLRDPQAPRSATMAETAQAVPHALHAHEQFVVEPDRTLVPRHHRTAHSPWRVQERRSIGAGDLRVHQPPQRQSSRFRLDCQG